MSDNQALREFIAKYAKPYDPAADDYECPPFAGDIKSEGRSEYYNFHYYHTKVPPEVIRDLLIHYTKPGDVIFDPFCGSGTILTEALQIGFTNLLGSDKNTVAVESTKKNIDWLKNKKTTLDTSAIKLFTADARDLGQNIEKHSLDAIVTELYLGPSRTGQERRGELQKLLSELSNL